MQNKKVLVTGGVGFIGNYLTKFLLKNNNDVTVFDNFSVKNNLKNVRSDHLEIIKGDCSSVNDFKKIPKNFDIIFHLAADPEVRLTVTNPNSIYKNNILATYNLLEWFRNSSIEKLVFTSTSAVYGEPQIFPTPESHACNPISLYGASKLSCESLVSAYCHSYKKRGLVLRLANVVGSLSRHGIIFDMIDKLKKNSDELEILGDGNQKKSYLYIDDFILGMIYAADKLNSQYQILNIGTNSQVTVNEIVDIILDELGFLQTRKNFTGGVDGGRGWVGDVKTMLLDIEKIQKLGWTPQLESKDAIRKTVSQLKS